MVTVIIVIITAITAVITINSPWMSSDPKWSHTLAIVINVGFISENKRVLLPVHKLRLDVNGSKEDFNIMKSVSPL